MTDDTHTRTYDSDHGCYIKYPRLYTSFSTPNARTLLYSSPSTTRQTYHEPASRKKDKKRCMSFAASSRGPLDVAILYCAFCLSFQLHSIKHFYDGQLFAHPLSYSFPSLSVRRSAPASLLESARRTDTAYHSQFSWSRLDALLWLFRRTLRLQTPRYTLR
jgi:hypothetical protein